MSNITLIQINYEDPYNNHLGEKNVAIIIWVAAFVVFIAFGHLLILGMIAFDNHSNSPKKHSLLNKVKHNYITLFKEKDQRFIKSILISKDTKQLCYCVSAEVENPIRCLSFQLITHTFMMSLAKTIPGTVLLGYRNLGGPLGYASSTVILVTNLIGGIAMLIAVIEGIIYKYVIHLVLRRIPEFDTDQVGKWIKWGNLVITFILTILQSFSNKLRLNYTRLMGYPIYNQVGDMHFYQQ